MRIIKKYGEDLILKELRKSYNFFIKEANLNKNSKGYGLIRDKTVYSNNVASIASVGFGLSALIVGVEHNWISYKKAYDRANRTLDTFLNNVEGKNGFYYHFVNMNTGKREWNCEISIIDTAIFICGAITAGEYFKKDVQKKAEALFKKINWEWYRNKENNLFYMGYKPERSFWGQWDMYAEQLMMYVLGVSSPTYPINKSMYFEFERKTRNYNNIKDIVYTYCGTIFTYQYSHAWIDFRNIIDKDGIQWFDNSVKATKANRLYCIENSSKFKTYGKDSWGATACVTPQGYNSQGAQPCDVDLKAKNDGTISPCGAIGSIVFTPKESISAMEYYYNNYKKLWGKYGFKDAYNLENEKEWFSKECIGIDKGIEVLMIENYLNETIWKYFMKNKYVIKGLEILGFEKIKDKKKLKI